MAESGGSTTQSGIHYQNSVAALYLGRLCDPTSRPDRESIIEVRVESPHQVDDIVVHFSDGHKAYIQAKENVKVGDDAWRKLWKDFEEQYSHKEFQKNRDRLVLKIGTPHNNFEALRQLFDMARGSNNSQEWQKRQNQQQKSLTDKILLLVSPTITSDILFNFFQHIEVEQWTLSAIERDMIFNWMPATNKSAKGIYRLLRDRVGGHARIKKSFTANDLRNSLQEDDQDLEFEVPIDIEELQRAIMGVGSLLRQHRHTIGQTDYHIKRSIVDDILKWATGNDTTRKVTMLVDQAGMGKTVVLRDVLYELDEKEVITLAIKADQQLSGLTNPTKIHEKLQLPQSIEVALQRLAKLKRVIVIIDQIDALSLSLAHDQESLNIVLDLVARIRRMPNVFILLSCRLFDRNSDPRLKQLEIAQQFTLPPLNDTEVRETLEYIGIPYGTLTGSAKVLLQTPLHLDLFVMSFKNDPSSIERLSKFESLQELYHLLWDNVILKREHKAPLPAIREEAIYYLTNQMVITQRTSSPLPREAEFDRSIDWLASMGILIPNKTEWSFFHQTFLDYCYARNFVYMNFDIIDFVLSSDQGILIRPKLIQIMIYLRGIDPNRYIKALNQFLKDSRLRRHLYDLLLQWFGALKEPTEQEKMIARRMLLNPMEHRKIIGVMYGNPGWFSFLLNEIFPKWLNNDDLVDGLVMNYLRGMLDVKSTQTSVANFLTSYINKDEKWFSRIANLTTSIRNFHTLEAINLFEQVVYKLKEISWHIIHKIEEIAQLDPSIGCRLVYFVLDNTLQLYIEKRRQKTLESIDSHSILFRSITLYNELLKFDNTPLDKVLDLISRSAPRLFLETLLPWLEKALYTNESFTGDEYKYGWDEFISDWHGTTFKTQHSILRSLCNALVEVGKSDSNFFREIASRLARIPYKTPQVLLAHAYSILPEFYANDSYTFLVTDQRRLSLGNSDQIVTRQLLKSIYIFLSDNQRNEIEGLIMSYAPLHKHMGVKGLSWRGIEQLNLLRAIPKDYLSLRALRRLEEWERKFPNYITSNVPNTIQSGFVGSPISESQARKMTDSAWLRAMQKYKGRIEHKDIIKGGSYELRSVLSSLVKEDPARFYGVFKNVQDDLDDNYVTAFLEGFSESNAPIEWLYETIRKFYDQKDRLIKREIGWAIQKRIKESPVIPKDIIDFLYKVFEDLIGEDELWWSKGDNHGDIYHSYLNSDRGNALRTLMRIYDSYNNDESINKKWELIEYVTKDPSTALRNGAIEELIYMVRYNRERATVNFEKIMEGHEILLESPFVREFLYWAFYKQFIRLLPYITQMMSHKFESVQESGAELISIASISQGALESEEAKHIVDRLVEDIFTGKATWRRGAARIFAHNIKGNLRDTVMSSIKRLIPDKDERVQDYLEMVFHNLDDNNFYELREYFEACAQSKIGLSRQFIEYLWKCGLIDATWTLNVVKNIVGQTEEQSYEPWAIGSDDLIRLVLRIYTDPTMDNEQRNDAMDIFDILMDKYSGPARNILDEWDRR